MSERTIRVGVVGLNMGRHHIEPYLKHPAARVVALADVDAARLKTVAREFSIASTYSSFADMLAAGGLDAVSLAVPNFLHEPMTLDALAAGLHVLCEKPLALNATQAGTMVDAADKACRKLAVHFNTRMSKEHQHVMAMHAAGDFGEIAHVRAGWIRQRGIPYWGGGWFCDRNKSGGGALIDVGVHALDAALAACGFPRVTSVTGRTFQRFAGVDPGIPPLDVEDMAVAFIRCDNGTAISIEVSWASHILELENVFVSVDGSRAGAHWRWTRTSPDAWDRLLETTSRSHNSLIRSRVTEFPPNLPTVQSDFIDAILNDREPVCSGRQGLLVMRLLDAIYESSRTGREVRLD